MAERLTLLDLRRKSGVVKYGDAEIEVHALSARDILDLMAKYDDFKRFLVGVSISAEDAIKSAPGIMAGIIVAGMREGANGALSRQEAEAIAYDIPAELQVKLMLTIWNASFTEGFGPFALGIRQIAEAAQIVSGRDRDTAWAPSSKPTPNGTNSHSATHGS